jgi:hypothetical protein
MLDKEKMLAQIEEIKSKQVKQAEELDKLTKQVAKSEEWDTSNNKHTYTDDEIKSVLMDQPTPVNIEKHAKRLKRTTGAIKTMWKFACFPIPRDMRGNPYRKQLKRIWNQMYIDFNQS